MTDAEVRDYLASQQTVIIVSNGRNGYPHPMPMWYYSDEDCVTHCTTFGKSQKVLNLRRDPRCTLLVESGTRYDQLRSVMIYSEAEVIDDYERVRDCLVNVSCKGRDVDDEERARIRERVANNAKKRVLLRFQPHSVVSWDHSKLGGRY